LCCGVAVKKRCDAILSLTEDRNKKLKVRYLEIEISITATHGLSIQNSIKRKTMKKYIIGIVITLIAYTVNAQRVVEKQVTVKPSASLDLKLDFADTIQIKQSNDNTLRIKVIVNINDNLHNDKYELITNESGDSFTIKAKIHDMESIKAPCKNHYNGSMFYSHDGECLTMDIRYILEVPAIANLRIETISGDIIIEDAKYPMSIKTISGFIDLGIPEKTNSDLRIETVTGGVYTNHEFTKDNSDCESNPGGTDASLRIGSGGNKIKLETVSGDIFVRKI